MTFVRAKVINKERVVRRIERLPEEARVEVGRAMRASALALETEMKRSIQGGPKSGVVYEKYRPRRTHRASAPGQPPATDTGRLAGSIGHEVDADGLGATVAANAHYAAPLEFGTLRMAARPFMGRALRKLRGRIERFVSEAIRAATRKR